MSSYVYLQQSIYIIIYHYLRKDGRFRHAENLEIVLTFEHNNFDKRNDFNEDSFTPNEGAQVIRMQLRQLHEFSNSNYLFLSSWSLL